MLILNSERGQERRGVQEDFLLFRQGQCQIVDSSYYRRVKVMGDEVVLCVDDICGGENSHIRLSLTWYVPMSG